MATKQTQPGAAALSSDSTVPVDATQNPTLSELPDVAYRDRRAVKEHIVEFYESDTSLIDSLGSFIGAALGSGEAAVVIATEAHRDDLDRRLLAQGVDLATIRERGRYVSLEAAKVLSTFLVDGKPDALLFAQIIGDLIEGARANAAENRRQVAVFGEMAPLLWAEGKRRDAIQLEKYWNDLALRHAFDFRCGYPLESLRSKEDLQAFLPICAEQSGVIPRESGAVSRSEDQRLRISRFLKRRTQTVDYESALSRSEERFQVLVESIRDFAIFLLDTAGCVASWNLGAERIKGYTAEEIIGRHFSVFYPQEEVEAGRPEHNLQMAAAQGHFEDESWRVRKDGSRFLAGVAITALRDKTGNLRGFAKVTRDLTDRRQFEETLRRVTGRLLALQDEERRRLARELHDSTAQTLAALAINLNLLEASGVAAHDPKPAQILSESQRFAEQASKEIRDLSHLLHPPDLDTLGLISAIRWFVAKFVERTGIQVAVDVPHSDLHVSDDVDIALFRVMQEALTNVHRHSGSATAQVRLEIRRNEVVMTIADQGCGIAPAILRGRERSAAKVGIGLAGMEERIRQLGGRLKIDSGGHGTTITISVPIARVES
jgi:PAS domain S-box-containing protein